MHITRLRRRFTRLAACAAAFVLVFTQFSGKAWLQIFQIQIAVDTLNTNQQGLLTLFGGAVTGARIGDPVAAADITGSGKAAVVFCEMYASSGLRQNNGQVNVYLSTGQDSGVINAATNPLTIMTLQGQSSGDLLGTAVATGDVNGDGLQDIVVSAGGNAGPAGLFDAGAVYIIPGSSNFVLNADLANTAPDGTPPAGITAIYGPQPNGRFGEYVSVADVDGDGIDDIVIGMDEMDSSTGIDVGGAYIIFGATNLPQVIDLGNPPAGVRITKIVGANSGDHWGATVYAGKIDNDSIADVAISAALNRDSAVYISPGNFDGIAVAGASDGGQRPLCGEVYVLYGQSDWPSEIDLSDPPANATHLIGANSDDFFGTQVFSADLNGDGQQDLIIGGLQALAPDAIAGRPGAVYVLYGSSTSIRGATIDMASPGTAPQQISIIYGQQDLDCTGDSVRAYDINNDGKADLFIGSPEINLVVNNQSREDAGCVDLIFGQSAFLPPVIKEYESPLAVPIYRLAGAHGLAQDINGTDEEGDEFGYRLAGADVNGDGYPDFVVSAQGGDGFNNALTEAGNVYVFSGKDLSSQLGMLQSSPPVLSQATLSANGTVVTQAPAGQSGLSVTVTGTGFSSTSTFTINGTQVTFTLATNPPSGSVQAVISLDQNLSIRNSIGALVVQARNTTPPSALSNTITAGTLTGPQISSINPTKSEGIIVLKIIGQGFQQGDTVSVTDSSGAVPLKAVVFGSASLLKARIGAKQVAKGTSVTVAVNTSVGIMSNQVSVTVP
ncbi:MAG TPA: FG-GAP repeat protein [Blastocatellia bacterium]